MIRQLQGIPILISYLKGGKEGEEVIQMLAIWALSNLALDGKYSLVTDWII